MNFEQWLEAKGFKLADLNDSRRRTSRRRSTPR
jgi:hypothetical protein